MLYETVVIARQDISPSHVEEMAESFAKVLTDNKAKCTKTEYCGLRPLAYPMNKNRKGHYVVMNIDAAPEALDELERQMRINEDVLRFLSIRVEEHNDGPSPLYKQSRSYIEGATRGQVFRSNEATAEAEAK